MRVEGFEQLSRKLNDLPDKVANRVLQKSVNKGLQEVAKDIRRAAPSGTERSPMSERYGKLKRNIRVGRLRSKGKYERAAKVHTRNAFWGWFLEKGTRYIPANPWFRPAWERGEKKIIDAMQKMLGDGIEKEARKK